MAVFTIGGQLAPEDPAPVESDVMICGSECVRNLCYGIKERWFSSLKVVGSLFSEVGIQENGLSEINGANLLAASLVPFITQNLATGEALGNPSDKGLALELVELRAALSANVVEEVRKGHVDPKYGVALVRDEVFLRTLVEQPLDSNVGAGASLLLTMYEQARTSLN